MDEVKVYVWRFPSCVCSTQERKYQLKVSITIKVMYRLTSSHQLTMHVSIQTITLIHELRHSSNVLFSYCIVLLDSKIYIITRFVFNLVLRQYPSRCAINTDSDMLTILPDKASLAELKKKLYVHTRMVGRNKKKLSSLIRVVFVVPAR